MAFEVGILAVSSPNSHSSSESNSHGSDGILGKVNKRGEILWKLLVVEIMWSIWKERTKHVFDRGSILWKNCIMQYSHHRIVQGLWLFLNSSNALTRMLIARISMEIQLYFQLCRKSM